MREDKKNSAREAQQEDPGPETNDATEQCRGREIHSHDVSDADIDKYATMPLAEVKAELHRHGVDPQKTIDAVTQLVNAKLKEWKAARRRALHGSHRRVAASGHRRHLHFHRRKLHRQLAARGLPTGIGIMGGALD